MKNRTLAALALVSLGLLVLASIDPWQRKKSAVLGRIVDAEAAATIWRVVLRSESGETNEIARDSLGNWRASGDKPGDELRLADPNAVRRLISAMTLLRASRQALPAAQHQLTAGAASIHYESTSGRSGDILLGALSADGKHRWIRLAAEGKALLVEAHLIGEILDARSSLLSRKLLPKRPGSKARLRLSRGTQWLLVQFPVMTWTGHDTPVPVSEARYVQLRDALGALEFLQPLPDSETCRAEQVSVVLEQGDETVQIRECGLCEGGLLALSIGDRAGCVAGNLWSKVLAAMLAPESLVEPAVLPSRRAEGVFTIRCGKQSLTVDPEQVDTRRLNRWWQAIDTGALAVEEELPPQTLCSVIGEDYQIHFGRIEETWYARVGESSLSRRLSAESSSLLRVDRTLFLSLNLISEDPLFATRIRVQEGGSSLVLERSELLEVWHSKGGALSDAAATQWALVLRAELGLLRADRFASQDIDRSAAKAARRIAVDFEVPVTGQTTHYDLLVVSAASAPGGSECLVQVNGQAAAWIAERRCQGLLAEFSQVLAK